jgi:hypothetical protein
VAGRLSAAKWKVFGPSSSYSDGDAEFFQLSNRLAQQNTWFAPPPQQQDWNEADDGARDQLQHNGQLLQGPPDRQRPLYGLTPQQIDALGLSGPRVATPDPVCALLARGGGVRVRRAHPALPSSGGEALLP